MFFSFGNMDKKTLYIILGVVAAISLLSMGTTGIMMTLLTLPGVIIAITFHEFAHAFVADKFGDTTPRSQGRLTLDPAQHLDPMGFFLLIFTRIGWGKPVQINPNNFTSNKSKESCEMWVSLAGPLTNFILSIILTVIYYALVIFIKNPNNVIQIIDDVVFYAIAVNIGLGVFNLIPIPPLDGVKIFKRFLPYKAVDWLDRNEQILYMIFLVLWITGLLSQIVAPVINVVYGLVFKLVGMVFSIFI